MPLIPWFNDHSTKNLTWYREYGDSPEIVAFSQITLLRYFNNHSLLAIIWHLHILMCMIKQRTQVSCSGSTPNISASIPSTPGALQQVFKWVIAAWTYSTVKGPASIQAILNLTELRHNLLAWFGTYHRGWSVKDLLEMFFPLVSDKIFLV